jgi:transcription antitermination factor NusG
MEQTETPELQWYAVHVRSRHEFQVHDRLLQKGIETFLPTVEKLRKWKDRKKLISFPLFPGYIFVHTTKEAHNLLGVLKVQGVVRML